MQGRFLVDLTLQLKVSNKKGRSLTVLVLKDRPWFSRRFFVICITFLPHQHKISELQRISLETLKKPFHTKLLVLWKVLYNQQQRFHNLDLIDYFILMKKTLYKLITVSALVSLAMPITSAQDSGTSGSGQTAPGRPALRQENRDLRQENKETRGKIMEERRETRGEIKDVRTDLRSGIKEDRMQMKENAMMAKDKMKAATTEEERKMIADQFKADRETMKEKISADRKETQDKLKSIREQSFTERKELRGKLSENRKQAVGNSIALIVERMKNGISKLEETSVKVENRIADLTSRGVDMSNATSLLATAKGAIESAKVAVLSTEEQLKAASGDSSKESFEKARLILKETGDQVKSARAALVEAISAVKAGAAVVSSSGTSDASVESNQ